ncbi:geraniol 8-hydroxylase-like protein [Tanacetum coccineum]
MLPAGESSDVLVATTDTVANMTTWIMAELLLNPDMLETLRLHAGSPLLAPHITLTKVKIGNYVVPKNTQIFVNVWAMARDPAYWESPLVFMPERFLQNKVEYKGQHYEFIPFGSGRRKCPGMPLAHRMLSLIVASLVYHFDWELPYAKEEMDMNDIFGLTLLKATPLVAIPIPLK